MAINVEEILQTKIEKSKHHLKEELTTVRAGKANAALVDRVMVDYYGSPTPLKSLANISVPDPRTLMISPFDPKSIPEIEKGINKADIGITPANDGKVIRLTIPQVTEVSISSVCSFSLVSSDSSRAKPHSRVRFHLPAPQNGCGFRWKRRCFPPGRSHPPVSRYPPLLPADCCYAHIR